MSILENHGTAPVSSSASASAPVSVSGEVGVVPPSWSVRARDELTSESLAKRAMIDTDSDEAAVAERLMERQRAASREHAQLLADLALWWVDRDDLELGDGREEMDLVAAIALRTTTSFAGSQLRDAHIAVTDLPRTYAQLAAGVMPIEWFTRLLVAVRSLTAVQRGQVDERVAVWELASIPAESFRRHLRTLIAWFTADQKPKTPQESRDVTFEPSDAWDQYMFEDQIRALIANGEYDRLARDAADIDHFHHYLTTTGELPNPDPPPPF